MATSKQKQSEGARVSSEDGWRFEDLDCAEGRLEAKDRRQRSGRARAGADISLGSVAVPFHGVMKRR